MSDEGKLKKTKMSKRLTSIRGRLQFDISLMDSRICLYTETRQKWRVSSILQRSWYL